MEIRGPEGVQGPGRVENRPKVKLDKAGAASSAGSSDRVEISPAARFLAQVKTVPDVRADRVASLREQIKRGQYETPDKVKTAVERILDELDGR